MSMTEERLTQIEERLNRIEALLARQPAGTGTAPQSLSATRATTTATVKAQASSTAPTKPKQSPAPHTEFSVTQLLGWTGAAAMVLASVFLIRLAVDSGWLTPWRQIGMALAGSVALIGVGLRYSAVDRQYASFLPAAGVVIQFCALYGAHLFYHLIPVDVAIGGVICICLFSLWLGQKFDNEIYALFAAVGSYSAPFLLSSYSGSVLDLAIYDSAWSVLFCVHAVWIGNRRPYLIAGYLAFLGFQLAADKFSGTEWEIAFFFQLVQFIIFVVATITFSMRRKMPMTSAEALTHLPLLLIFYVLQYAILQIHIPAYAPWIAIASAAAILLAYFVAKISIAVPLQSTEILIGSYVSIVLYHAFYIELVPTNAAPWVGLLALPLAFLALVILKGKLSDTRPYQIVVAVIFCTNFVRVMEGTTLHDVAAHSLLSLVYAVELYIAYYLSKTIKEFAQMTVVPLYAAHIALMCAAVHILDDRLAVSVAWSIIGILSLLLAFRLRDKILGKSSLIIFAASCAKVLLFDLSSATPLVRIGTLLVLGVTLYAGGWMYKKVDAMEVNV